MFLSTTQLATKGVKRRGQLTHIGRIIKCKCYKNVFSRWRKVAYKTYCTWGASLMEPPRISAYTLYF